MDLCRPFCNLEPETLEQMSRLLPMVQKTVSSGDSIIGKLKSEGLDDVMKQPSHLQTRIKQISENVSQQQGTTSDLFDLIDLDTISVEEFQMCTVRLGFQLSEHRMN